jgi:hypothetical protein
MGSARPGMTSLGSSEPPAALRSSDRPRREDFFGPCGTGLSGWPHMEEW